MIITDLDGVILTKAVINGVVIYQPVTNMIQFLNLQKQIVMVLTHRKHERWGETLNQLHRTGLHYDGGLIMRGDDDNRSPAEFKTAWLRTFNGEVSIFIDNDTTTCEAVRKEFPSIVVMEVKQ
jgi:hypothetical protein